MPDLPIYEYIHNKDKKDIVIEQECRHEGDQMMISVANHAWLGWTYYKPELYIRGLVDGNGRMVEHRRGHKYWENSSTLQYAERLVIFFYCGSTSTHMYLKVSYDYFKSRTWPFASYPRPEDYMPPLPVEDLVILDPAPENPIYEWSSNVTSDIN